jgi:hypothetical protein
VPLSTLVRVAGQRWRIEESLQAAEGLVGLGTSGSHRASHSTNPVPVRRPAPPSETAPSTGSSPGHDGDDDTKPAPVNATIAATFNINDQELRLQYKAANTT